MSEQTWPLELDVSGRVGNMRLPGGRAIHAIFEAVVNSIQAILDGPGARDGQIVIRVLRLPGQAGMDGKAILGPVFGFEIEDNGIGFDDANFSSFRKSDSTAKLRYGGKGVGRLLWLKVFKTITISSVFKSGQSLKKRELRFSQAGISGPQPQPTDERPRTLVTLKDPNEAYHEALQLEPEAIARKTIEHCIEFFISDPVPSIEIEDLQAGFRGNLVQMFRNDLKADIKTDDFKLNDHKFRITHLLVRGRKNSKHSIHLCAHCRRVKEEPVSGRIPGLQGGLRPDGSEQDLAYHGYLSGKLLDELAEASRVGFEAGDLFGFDPSKEEEGVISLDDLIAKATTYSRKFLEPTLRPLLAENEKRVRTRIETSFPQYRHLLKHRAEDVSGIPPGVEGVELDLALYKIEQELDGKNREALSRELAAPVEADEPPDKRREILLKLLEQLNDSGTSKLARHVVYRRAVIKFLEDQIGLQKDGRYSLEEAVHNAICPTKTDSDETPLSKMNLWLLDDRLSYHYYLASDLAFKAMKETVQRDSEDRPDLAIFHRTMAFSDSPDQVGAVVLVEFKRPVREGYSVGDDDKDPVLQVINYVRTLRSGAGRGPKGEAIHIPAQAPFFAYIIADLTPGLRSLLDAQDFQPTPDSQGYFRFYTNQKCYVEVISFKKMLADAKKRNQAFFDKLNIPLP